MAFMAFDTDKNDLIYADTAVHKEKGKYLCYNSLCRAKGVEVYYRDSKPNGCFVSYDIEAHDKNCDFVTSFKAEYVNAKSEDFDVDDFLIKITAEEKSYQSPNNKIASPKRTLSESVDVRTFYIHLD